MRGSEESVNAVLAVMIFEKLSERFEKLLSGTLIKYSSRRAELNVFLSELF